MSDFLDKPTKPVNWILIGLFILLLIPGLTFYTEQRAQRQAINDQSDRIEQLVSQVDKTAKQNQDYIYCNSLLLAQYTQTQQPIVIKDLKKCQTEPANIQQQIEGSRGATAQPVPMNDTELMSPTVTQRPAQTQGSSSPTPSQTPADEQNQTTQEQDKLLSIPNLLDVSVPCVDVAGLLKTCK